MASVQTSSVPLRDGRVLGYRLSRPSGAEDNGRIVLLSNSLMAPYRMWDNFVSHLLSNSLSVLCYDQIGHGSSSVNASTVEETTFQTLATDVQELLHALKITVLYAWVGCSMGAATGLIFSVQNPGRVRRLVLCDTISSSPAAAGSPDVFEARVQAAKKEGNLDVLVESTLDRWFSKEWQVQNESEVQRMRGIMKTTKVEGFVACCRALQDKDFDLRPFAHKVGSAVERAMIVVGELDANLPDTMADLKKQIDESFKQAGNNSQAEWALIKRAGHVCVIDGFEDYKTAVTSFLL
jgi:3-oxoadipate enol-lactonase